LSTIGTATMTMGLAVKIATASHRPHVADQLADKARRMSANWR
jgi:hypothetical protein